jgi:alkanesulfonate monooxygenase SsuD/methylene tetrahydromethanopterin reductase-like flavin-dependent oxidoreductase (luciferase family)
MPVSFGINLSIPAAPDADPVALARRAEAAGFDFVSASDHLHGDIATFEPWTLLSTVAATTNLRVATRVLAVPYRHPGVVAKMAETLDRLSGGRVILGLGGGYIDDEFRSLGLRVPSPREKIERLEEAVRIARAVWSDNDVHFEGRHYRLDGATVEPKPGHRIPIWLGTYRPLGLALTGRLADGWIPSYGFSPPDEVSTLRAQVDAAAIEAGRDPSEIVGIYNMELRMGDGPPLAGGVSGSADEILGRLNELVELGFAGFNFAIVGGDRVSQVEQLGAEVLPAVRTARVGTS